MRAEEEEEVARGEGSRDRAQQSKSSTYAQAVESAEGEGSVPGACIFEDHTKRGGQ